MKEATKRLDRFEKLILELVEQLKMTQQSMDRLYAGSSIEKSTIDILTEKNIYAMIIDGDIVEIVNFEEVKRRGNEKRRE